MPMRATGDWMELDENHFAQFVSANGKIIGLSLLHNIKDMGAILCDEIGLVQWEPYGTIRPIFTVVSKNGQPLTLSPFVICPVCGDTGTISEGKWIPKERDEKFELRVEDALIQMDRADRCGDCKDCKSPEPVWCETWRSRPDDAVLRAAQQKRRNRERALQVQLGDEFEELTGDDTVVGVPTPPEEPVAKLGGHAVVTEEMANLWRDKMDYTPEYAVPENLSEENRYSHRKEVLDATAKAVLRDRNNSYGPPHQDFERTANAISALWRHKLAPGEMIRAHDVAVFIAVVKLSRIQWSPEHFDSWTDLAGYAACGYEAYMMTHDDFDARDES